MKYSTGRGTRMKHSTAMEWDEFERRKKKASRVRYSTGENASIKHACGIELDLKSEEIDDAIEAKKREIEEKEWLEKQKASRKNKETPDDLKKSINKVPFEY